VHNTEGLLLYDELTVIMKLGKREFAFPSQINNLAKTRIGVRFEKLSQEQERDLILCTFARADAWVNWNEGRSVDRPLESLREILDIGIKCYGTLFHNNKTNAPK
jgi:cellulose synthase (UDP-forming)